MNVSIKFVPYYSSHYPSWKSWYKSLIHALSSIQVSPKKTKASLSSTLLSFHVTDSSVLSTPYMAISNEYVNELNLSPMCFSKCYQCQLNRQTPISFGFSLFSSYFKFLYHANSSDGPCHIKYQKQKTNPIMSRTQNT